AEEVGFEPTVPETGTPVFETGPFNHSGTPPGIGCNVGRWIGALSSEEPGEQGGAFLGQEAAPDDSPVIQATIGGQSKEGIPGPSLGIGGTVDYQREASLHDCPGAHRAGLQGGVEAAAIESPGAQGMSGQGHCESLGMSSGVGERLSQVER